MASKNIGDNVEIKIKTMDHQTHTIRVEKSASVPTLKEQIAQVTGVVSDRQRLLFCGKFLKDDQNLSSYHLENGHTLHLVVRQPIDPLPESADINPSEPGSPESSDLESTEHDALEHATQQQLNMVLIMEQILRLMMDRIVAARLELENVENRIVNVGLELENVENRVVDVVLELTHGSDNAMNVDGCENNNLSGDQESRRRDDDDDDDPSVQEPEAKRQRRD